MLYDGSASEKVPFRGSARERGAFAASFRNVDGWVPTPRPGVFNTLWPALRPGVSFFAPVPTDYVATRKEADALAIAYSLAF